MWWKRPPRGAGFQPATGAEAVPEGGLEARPTRTEAEPTRPGHGEFEQVARYYDALMARVPYERWVDYVERLMETREPHPLPPPLAGEGVGEHRRDAGATQRPQRVLDLACGTGKVGSELLRRGYAVVGADLSEQMARGGATQRPALPVAVMDATRLGLRAASLDLVVCLYDSLNYVLEPEGLRECFRRVREALALGGLFIFDLNTPRALKIGLFTQQELHPGAPVQYRWEAHWDEATKICRVDMWFRAGRGKGEGGRGNVGRGEREAEEFTETHYERAYEEAEVKRWLREAGFSYARSYEAYTLSPVGPRAERMFFVAQGEPHPLPPPLAGEGVEKG